MKQVFFTFWVGWVILFLNGEAFSATYTVSSTADAGANTLRQAILDANASGGADIIQFNFGVPVTITLSSCLPALTGPVTINGYSDPASGPGNLMIEVISPAGCNGFDFGPGSDGSIIQGLVISGGTNGVTLRNSSNHVVKGNYIGTNRMGTATATSRPQNCILITSATNCTIGGTGGQAERNILSGATQDGIRCTQSTGIIVINNYIGVSASGNAAITNGSHGIEAYNNSHNLRVGGTTTAERNVISGNTGNGLYTNNCMSPVVKGNIFGMGVDGTTKLGNGQSGIDIENTSTGAAQIGGITLAERNYSSCNGSFGLVVRYANNAVIEGNWLGVDIATGNQDYGNYDAAITVTNSADVRVGGSVAGSGNICSASGNPGGGADGISIWSSSPRPIIKGNIIGLGADTITSLQNYGHGIECLTCDDGIIGGTTLLERNFIASSFLIGIQLVNSPRVTIYNNYLGTDVTGTLDRGGAQMGIHVSNSNSVIIGGSTANANIVAHNNASAGIVVESDSKYVTITYNSIFCNTGPGIDLTGTANESVPTPTVVSSTTNNANGTGVDGDVIHLYLNNTSDGGVKCDCEGEVYLGTTTVSGGVWSITHNLGLSTASANTVTATQTTPLGSTSEFSPCVSSPLPVELLYFNVQRVDPTTVYISWATATEHNNDYFEVEYSLDAISSELLATVAGHGTSNQSHDYSVADHHAIEKWLYYRLVQIDIDGEKHFSSWQMVSMEQQDLQLIVSGRSLLILNGEENASLFYQVYTTTGTVVFSGTCKGVESLIYIPDQLATGIYLVQLSNRQKFLRRKIYLE